MSTMRTILHPTDFSPCSEVAGRLARELARDQGARLVVLSVTPVPGVVPGPIPIEPRFFWDDLEETRRQLDGSDLKHGVESQLRRGEIVEEILRAADELDCDLIIIGSHGRGALFRMLVGSVAEALLRRSVRPVLLVKPGTASVTPDGSGQTTGTSQSAP
jgi:nucleotide-binding universal stress UspA family protein